MDRQQYQQHHETIPVQQPQQQQTPPTRRIVVLVSGAGSNLQAILDARKELNINVVLVVSNKPNVGALARAAAHNIPTAVVPFTRHPVAQSSLTTTTGIATPETNNTTTAHRLKYDIELAQLVAAASPDLVLLAGWMHILSPAFLAAFKEGHVLNLHPALPGRFDGIRAIERAHQAALDEGCLESGVIVHVVTPVVDEGRVVHSECVPVAKTDSFSDFKERMHAAEHRVIVEAVRRFFDADSA